jgi:transposase
MNKRSEREMNVIGIDVSKAKLDGAWLKPDNKIKTKVFANQQTGWKDLLDWAKTQTGAESNELQFVMEATGIYHENLATWLYDNGANVAIVNPAQVKYYAQSLGSVDISKMVCKNFI